MFLTAKPFERGGISIVTGPVDSDKTRRINGFLDAVVDSGYKRGDNIVVFRHPDDDKYPERIGKHEVKVTDNIGGICKGILPQTRTVVIVGASHYRDEKIVDLADAIVKSNRDLLVSGLNLDAEGRPHGFMPELITLADEILLAKAICSHNGCRSMEATRSIRRGNSYSAVCAHHYRFDCPPISREFSGFLKLYLGSMYSGKTTEWGSDLNKIQEVGWNPLVLKYFGDDRDGEEERELFGEGYVTLHKGERIPAVLVKTGEDIKEYLESHPDRKYVFLNEGQFIKGLYDLVFELIPKGYKFCIDALLRGFNRKKFGEGAELVCLADVVNMNYATCVVCGHPAGENQRMKRVGEMVLPAHSDDSLEVVGGKDDGKVKYFYEARCLRHWVLEGELDLRYELKPFSF